MKSSSQNKCWLIWLDANLAFTFLLLPDVQNLRIMALWEHADWKGPEEVSSPDILLKVGSDQVTQGFNPVGS